jgi:hypothetical protein
MIAPINAANTSIRPSPPASTVGFTIPLAIVAATLIEMNAPTKFSPADINTATRGFSAPVAIDVATAFAVSVVKPTCEIERKRTDHNQHQDQRDGTSIWRRNESPPVSIAPSTAWRGKRGSFTWVIAFAPAVRAQWRGRSHRAGDLELAAERTPPRRSDPRVSRDAGRTRAAHNHGAPAPMLGERMPEPLYATFSRLGYVKAANRAIATCLREGQSSTGHGLGPASERGPEGAGSTSARHGGLTHCLCGAPYGLPAGCPRRRSSLLAAAMRI